ncbi:hypothetical protein KL906_002307 [Ogataea polymorpha]|uniref:MADS-box domain-containing protein n=1 Tax=Ogataea polymorpha TaxID=460523 RepID=A0A9P8TEM9_9ASCO|nr:hypothetical protein KL906_002307 [Ogataea polymorpha]KAG7917073.1 hypothetical protein KL927_002847 [Ogataea polymorpha]KAH3676773.1 hypothetical protein OGATHE_001263 [Ogataea polymorpha]
MANLKQESQASEQPDLNLQPQNSELEDDENEDSKPSNKRERRKIEIRFIQEKSRRHITFSKRKAGIMKKAYELSVLTGTQVLLLVVSETGLVYTFTTPKLQPLVTKPEGKNLIQACLNAPEEPSNEDDDAQAGGVPDTHAPQGHPSAQHMHPQLQPQQPQQPLPPPPQGQPQADPSQAGQPPYHIPQMGNNYLNPDQSNYYMGFNGNQGYN